MSHLFGYDLDLEIDTVLIRRDGPVLCIASDERGVRWLAYRSGSSPTTITWLCSPVSDVAIRSVVADGRLPRDAMRHSLTGTAEVIRVVDGHSVPDQCLPCGQIPEGILPPADVSLGTPAVGLVVDINEARELAGGFVDQSERWTVDVSTRPLLTA